MADANHFKAGTAWSRADETVLTAMWRLGTSLAEASRKLGRSEDACRDKCRMLLGSAWTLTGSRFTVNGPAIEGDDETPREAAMVACDRHLADLKREHPNRRYAATPRNEEHTLVRVPRAYQAIGSFGASPAALCVAEA